MAKIEIYTTFMCPFCARAIALFERKGVAFQETDVTRRGADHDRMVQRANGRTTKPQIFIDGKHIGGCDDLLALDAAGTLDPLLR
jgi:glutaredoxin 3